MARAAKKTSNADPTTAELQAQLEALKDDILALGESLGTYGRSRGEDLKGAAENRARHLRDTAEQSVRRNPSAAIGVAAAIGFVVGLLLSRR